jgi:D-lyxose ketol-isomerase
MADNVPFPFQVSGPERDQALEKIYETVGAWGLKLPDVEPLALDFGLGRFKEIGETEFWISNEEEKGYCGKLLFVQDGQTCPSHMHQHKHETFFVVKGQVRMIVDHRERVLSEGEILVMLPGQYHSFTGIGPALLLEVSMPSQRGDNFFVDPAIGDNGVI